MSPRLSHNADCRGNTRDPGCVGTRLTTASDSPALRALLLLSRARAAANASLDAALSRVGLWLDDLALLTLLEDGPLTRTQLAERLSLSASDTVRRVNSEVWLAESLDDAEIETLRSLLARLVP